METKNRSKKAKPKSHTSRSNIKTKKMKRINFLLIVFLIAGAAVFTSCKKETKIEKNLWKKGGEWNVESLYAKQISTNSADNFEETIYNYGTFTFKENGSGNYTITVDGDFEAGAFTYSNTEDKLTLIIDNQARIFDIVDWEKNKMKISITENFTSSGESITYTETMNLKKK